MNVRVGKSNDETHHLAIGSVLVGINFFGGCLNKDDY
jgi:hypothetical protein